MPVADTPTPIDPPHNLTVLPPTQPRIEQELGGLPENDQPQPAAVNGGYDPLFTMPSARPRLLLAATSFAQKAIFICAGDMPLMVRQRQIKLHAGCIKIITQSASIIDLAEYCMRSGHKRDKPILTGAEELAFIEQALVSWAAAGCPKSGEACPVCASVVDPVDHVDTEGDDAIPLGIRRYRVQGRACSNCGWSDVTETTLSIR
jgi:hypothetical protein